MEFWYFLEIDSPLFCILFYNSLIFGKKLEKMSIRLRWIFASWIYNFDLENLPGSPDNKLKEACLRISFQNALEGSTKQHQELWLWTKENPSYTRIKLNYEGLIKSRTSCFTPQNRQINEFDYVHYHPKTAKKIEEVTLEIHFLDIWQSNIINCSKIKFTPV